MNGYHINFKPDGTQELKRPDGTIIATHYTDGEVIFETVPFNDEDWKAIDYFYSDIL